MLVGTGLLYLIGVIAVYGLVWTTIIGGLLLILLWLNDSWPNEPVRV
jgi:hypothetical protein